MAEPTLALKYADLCGETGLFLGYGRGAALGDQAWTTQQQAAIESCVRSGQRNFYYPPPMGEGAESYEWSFLRPTASLALAEAASTITLPDDFGGVEGDLTLSSDVSSFLPVKLAGEAVVRQKHALYPDTTGRPEAAAVRPLKGAGSSQGQRFQLYVWPTADQDYTLRLTYYVNPDALDGAFPYQLGGVQHAETLLESCLAIAEQRLDDASGVHTAKFMERLAASIAADRKLKPQTLGYNGDRSDRDEGAGRRGWWGSPVTINGVNY